MALSPEQKQKIRDHMKVNHVKGGCPLCGGGSDAGWKIGGLDGAAERLGLKRTTLLSRMKKLEIQRQAQ